MRALLVSVVLAVAIASGAGGALAGNPNDSQYGNVAAQTTSNSSQPKSVFTPPSQSGGSTLPFTGLDLGLVGGGGLIAIIGGVALRRVARKQTGAQ
jgi:hypothetical protein